MPFRRAQFHMQGRLALSHAEHHEVVAAVSRGDSAAAHATMLHHVSLVEDAFDELSTSAARRGAPVSTPLTWEELSPSIQPGRFTVETLLTRLRHLAPLP